MIVGEDQRARGPERIDRILARVLKEAGLEDGERHGVLARAWREAAGPDLAPLTKVHAVRGGEVTIAVESAPLFQELTTYRAEELLREVRERAQGVRVDRLRFRLV